MEERAFDITKWKTSLMRWVHGNNKRIKQVFKPRGACNTLSYEEFENCIRGTGVPTPRSCFLIFREFDRENNGFIMLTDIESNLAPFKIMQNAGKFRKKSEHIDWLVQSEVDRCSCDTPFKCVQVDECKYRFGDKQRLYLVRTSVNNTCIMVRVGGGFITLREFLDKHDPCRILSS